MTIAPSATKANQARLLWPCGRMIKAANTGPIELPKLPPSWNSDCAMPCAPPEASRASRDASGWKIDAPRPSRAAPASSARKLRRIGEQADAEQRASHAIGQRIRLRLAIGVETDQRLQQRGDALKDQRDKFDLTKAQIERALENRIDRRQQRHDQVVQQMAKADRCQDDKCSAAGLLPAHDGLSSREKPFQPSRE